MTIFSARHYEAIARTVRTARWQVGADDQEVIDRIEYHLANLFAEDNPRFRREQFNRACELTDYHPTGETL